MSSSTRIRAQDRFAHVSVAFSSRSKSRTESKKRGGYFPFPPCSIAETGPCLFLKKDLKKALPYQQKGFASLTAKVMIEPLLSGYLKRVIRKIFSSLGSLTENGIESLYNEFIFSGLETRRD